MILAMINEMNGFRWNKKTDLARFFWLDCHLRD